MESAPIYSRAAGRQAPSVRAPCGGKCLESWVEMSRGVLSKPHLHPTGRSGSRLPALVGPQLSVSACGAGLYSASSGPVLRPPVSDVETDVCSTLLQDTLICTLNCEQREIQPRGGVCEPEWQVLPCICGGTLGTFSYFFFFK